MRRDELRQNRGGTYIETINPLGYDILVNGSNRYLNFNAISGSSGYGIRDNSGAIEYKNSGGSRTAVNQTVEGASYTHTQSTPSTTRTMTHNLGYNPNYIAVDSIGRQFFAAPSRPDMNTMVLTLSAATSGVAYLS